jgi:hypothetical protein
MSVTHFKINLPNQHDVYYAGDTIIGSLHLKLKEKLRVNCVRLSATGYGKVHW